MAASGRFRRSEADGDGAPRVSLDRTRSSELAAEAGARVLLVEDDPTIQNMLAEALRESGFTVGIAASGFEMDRAMQKEGVDLVLPRPHATGRGRARRSARAFAAGARHAHHHGDRARRGFDRIVGLEIGADDYVTNRSTRAN